MSPWGLRVQIFPNVRKMESDLKIEWENNLQDCSFKIMDLLCQHYSKELDLVDREIEKLYTDNTNLITDLSFNKREEDLKVHVESFVGDLLKTKEKKLLETS